MEGLRSKNSKIPTPSTPAEIEILFDQLKEKEARMAERAKAMEQEHEAIAEERERFNRERETTRAEQENTKRDLNEIRTALQQREDDFHNRRDTVLMPPVDDIQHGDVLMKLHELQREVECLRANPGPLLTTERNTCSPRFREDVENTGPRVSFKEALEPVPSFDGYNVSLAQFARACRRARDIIPPSSEVHLTRLLINKLRGRAYYAVEDERCESVIQLLDLLSEAFGSAKTIDQYRGELSTIFLRPNEHVLDYVARVKELRSAILDMERREMGPLPNQTIDAIDHLTARSFCEGLPLEYRLQLYPEHHRNPFEAFSRAKILAKRHELDKERYKAPTPRTDRYSGRAPDEYVRRPAASFTQPRYVPDSRDKEYQRPPPPREPWARRAPQIADSYNAPRPGPLQRYSGTESQGRGFDSGNRRFEAGRAIERDNRRPFPSRAQDSSKWCRYCKNNGHVIEECRKRQYNNSRTQPGNANNHLGNTPDGPRVEPKAYPSRPIHAVEAEQPSAERSEESQH